MLEVLELVEARAGGRQEHDIAASGIASGARDGGRQIAAPLETDSGRRKCALELVRRLADQVDSLDIGTDCPDERLEALPFERPAHDHPERVPFVRRQRTPGGSSVCRLRVVDVADTTEL